MTILEFLKQSSVPIILRNMEDPSFFVVQRTRELFMRMLRTADIIYTHTRQYLDYYGDIGKPVHYLPSGARPDMLGEPLTEHKMKYDYSFLGAETDKRTELVRELAKRLPNMKCRIAGPGMPPEDYLEMIRETRVNLTFSTTRDVWEQPDWGLSDRVWEIPYAGGFLLQDKRRHAADHFSPDEIATFSTIDECAEKIEYFAAHPEERHQILDKARRRIHSEHLVAHRIGTIIEDMAAEGLI